jgi:hypothetical protein
MSSGSPSTLRPRFPLTPGLKIGIVAWVVLMIGAFVLSSINSSKTEALHDDVNQARKSIEDLWIDHKSGNPEMKKALTDIRHDCGSLTERISQLESALGEDSVVSLERDLTKSKLAVQRANAAKHEAIANAVIRDLGKLKSLQTEWATLESQFLNGPVGGRVAGSIKHLEQVVELLQKERPAAEKIVEWESQLNPLVEPFTQVGSDSSIVAITDEHAQQLNDLGKELKTQVTEFQRQKLLLESIQRETSGLAPNELKLVDAIEQHRVQRERAEADRLAEVRETARAEAEKAGAERIAKAVQGLTNDRLKQKEQDIADENEQVAAEGRLKDLKHKATLAGLTEEANRAEDSLRWAQLDREMQRDMNEINGLLRAYTSPGFTYRPDDTKGPVSYSLIRSSGGLEATRKGLGNLFFIATGNSDRDRGGLPAGVGGHISSSTPTAPIERAQELLIKYGELMVRKGMLAP